MRQKIIVIIVTIIFCFFSFNSDVQSGFFEDLKKGIDDVEKAIDDLTSEKQEEQPSEQEESKKMQRKPSEKTKITKNILVVKGLYLGMYIEDASNIVSEKLGEKLKIGEDHASSESVNIDFDEYGKINFINIQDTNKLFGMSQIDTPEFVSKFRKAYNIPRMKMFFMEKNLFGHTTGYRYISPKGFQVEITQQFAHESGQVLDNLNWLTIQKIEKKKKGSFD